jgi:hypothetical protein
MKKLLAMFAVFGLAALVAGYVALAPLALSAPGPLQSAIELLDRGAFRIIDMAGRSTAVLALLGGGMVLGLIATALTGIKAGKFDREEHAPEPGPVWRPEPMSSEDRIASLRRRAGAPVAEPAASPDAEGPAPNDEAAEHAACEELPADVAPAGEEPAHEEPAVIEDEPPGQPPRPVILARKVRTGDGDWTATASWLGGLPRLAGGQWPRDTEGRALPFAAQISLTELTAACPESPLPREGSLAFFLGSGAVVAVPPGECDFTEPPSDLPPAFDEDGTPLPAAHTRLSRYLFPFWPVEPVALSLPENLLDHRVSERQEEIRSSANDMIRAQFGEPSVSVAAAGEDPLWWHGVFHIADQLHEAAEDAGRAIAAEVEQESRAEDALAALEGRGDALPEAIAGSRRKVHDIRIRRQQLEAEAAELPAMVEALDSFIANREPWDELTTEERSLVGEILSELHHRHGRLIKDRIPHSMEPLQALCIRSMAAGAPDAFAALPANVHDRIALHHRVPAPAPHQIFGLGWTTPTANDDDPDDLLLLQLGYDDLAEWRWPEGGQVQFRISAQDATSGNWEKARLIYTRG